MADTILGGNTGREKDEVNKEEGEIWKKIINWAWKSGHSPPLHPVQQNAAKYIIILTIIDL
jgi:hypothetical protein